MINHSILGIVEEKAVKWFKGGCLYKSDISEDNKDYSYIIENGWDGFDIKSFLTNLDIKKLDTLSPEARIMIFTMSIHHNINFFNIAERVSFLESGNSENPGYYAEALVRILTYISCISITSRAWLGFELVEEKLTNNSLSYFKSVIDHRDTRRVVNICNNVKKYVFTNNVRSWMTGIMESMQNTNENLANEIKKDISIFKEYKKAA